MKRTQKIKTSAQSNFTQLSKSIYKAPFKQTFSKAPLTSRSVQTRPHHRHIGGSITFTRLSQCAPHLVHPISIRTIHMSLLLSRFEYVYHQICPGMFWASPFSPSKLPLHVWGSGPHLIHGSWAQLNQHSKWHHDRFGCFCSVHDHDRQPNRPHYSIWSNGPHQASAAMWSIYSKQLKTN